MTRESSTESIEMELVLAIPDLQRHIEYKTLHNLCCTSTAVRGVVNYLRRSVEFWKLSLSTHKSTNAAVLEWCCSEEQRRSRTRFSLLQTPENCLAIVDYLARSEKKDPGSVVDSIILDNISYVVVGKLPLTIFDILITSTNFTWQCEGQRVRYSQSLYRVLMSSNTVYLHYRKLGLAASVVLECLLRIDNNIALSRFIKYSEVDPELYTPIHMKSAVKILGYSRKASELVLVSKEVIASIAPEERESLVRQVNISYSCDIRRLERHWGVHYTY